MKSTKVALAQRGFVDDEFVKSFANKNIKELITLLQSNVPQERTAAAKILGAKKEKSAIKHLCLALEKEKSLYSKISISNALSNIGEAAIPSLIKLLGKIGNNQHKAPPAKPFRKKSYPLPRDIAARTIIRIGETALPYLEECLIVGSEAQISEAIDAIGHIAFYSKNSRALNA